jgi:hypothetical protein
MDFGFCKCFCHFCSNGVSETKDGAISYNEYLKVSPCSFLEHILTSYSCIAVLGDVTMLSIAKFCAITLLTKCALPRELG